MLAVDSSGGHLIFKLPDPADHFTGWSTRHETYVRVVTPFFLSSPSFFLFIYLFISHTKRSRIGPTTPSVEAPAFAKTGKLYKREITWQQPMITDVVVPI